MQAVKVNLFQADELIVLVMFQHCNHIHCIFELKTKQFALYSIYRNFNGLLRVTNNKSEWKICLKISFHQFNSPDYLKFLKNAMC